MTNSGSDGLRSLALAARARPNVTEKNKRYKIPPFLNITHPDHDAVLSLKFGDVFVPPRNLRAIQWPETAHDFNGALRRVRHLPPVTESREHRPDHTHTDGYRHGRRGGDTASLQNPGLGCCFPARVTHRKSRVGGSPGLRFGDVTSYSSPSRRLTEK